MRYVIFGAGAIGGAIGGMLHKAGLEVVLIARGSHLETLSSSGLRLRTPDEDFTVQIPTAPGPKAAQIQPDDVVVLAMKTQDTGKALDELSRDCPHDVPIVSAQNGVENERLALRRFSRVYSMLSGSPRSTSCPDRSTSTTPPPMAFSI